MEQEKHFLEWKDALCVCMHLSWLLHYFRKDQGLSGTAQLWQCWGYKHMKRERR